MKKTLALVLTLAMVLTAVFALAACGEKETITLWVSELVKKDGDGEDAKVVDSVVDMTKRQIEAFVKANPDIDWNYEVKIEGVTEADAGSKVIADVASAPDIYCFAQDQLARLVQASALAAPGKAAQEFISETNDAGAVGAATVGETIYAYPMTSDNGYYLYYDKSVITNPDSLEQIIADCEAAGTKFRFALENAWYTASFFFATGCESNWTVGDDGKYTGVEDTFNSAKGLIAMKGMQKLAQSTCYDSNADIFDQCSAIVTGVWNSPAAKTHFKDNLAATDLPSFEVDGQSYHLGSYSGNKLMGVKPQTDPEKGALLQKLAQWLTNDANQLERFNTFGWGPSSKKAQQDDAVKADPSLGALVAQNAYAIPQPQIHGSWWDIAKVLGAEAKAAQSDADLQAALDAYDEAIAAVLGMSDEAKSAWTVIGSFATSNWNGDIKMTPNADKTVWVSEPIVFNADEEFKVRQGKSWDVNFGADGAANGANIKLTEAGTYVITLTLTYDGENIASATITWAKQ